MAKIEKYVDVRIDRQTRQISIASFEIPLLLVRVDESTITMPSRVMTFSDADAVAAFFGDTHEATKMATALKSGGMTVTEFKVGKVRYSTAPVQATVSGEVETIIDNPTSYTVLTEPENGSVVVQSATGSYVYTGDLNFAGQDSFTVKVENEEGDSEDVEVTVDAVLQPLNESYSDALRACMREDTSWYALASEARFDQDVLSLAAIIQANRRIYGAATSDASNAAVGTNSLSATLKRSGYDRTFVFYSADAAKYPECAWIGSQLAHQAGSNTWAFKNLQGIAVSENPLSDTQINALEENNCNYLDVVGGARVTARGCMADGEWIDTIVFSDWLTARMEENVWELFVNLAKVPMTRDGATMIEARIREVLERGVSVGGIANDTPYTVIAPDPLAIPVAERGKRILGDFHFTARLAGAVHKTTIRGIVSY